MSKVLTFRRIDTSQLTIVKNDDEKKNETGKNALIPIYPYLYRMDFKAAKSGTETWSEKKCIYTYAGDI